MEEGIENQVAPGAALLVGKFGEIVFTHACGQRYLRPERPIEANKMAIDTVFDIGAITSVLVTTTLVMQLVENGKLRLDDKVSRFVQGFGVLGKSLITIEHLLTHTSGIVGAHAFYEELSKANSGARLGIMTSRGAKDQIINTIIRMSLKYETGSKQVYSELGFIVLGYIVEMLTGLGLEKAAHRYIFQPLMMKSSSFIDLSMIKRRGIHPVTDMIAPTEDCPWRKRVLCGEVHDENAWAMGGIAGHSGLFSTVFDTHLFASEILSAYRGSSSFLKRQTLLDFWKPVQATANQDASRRAGWDSPSDENGMESSKLSENAVGIQGSTGCSLWLEPDDGLEIILFTNRIHPSRSNKKIQSFRSQLHSLAVSAVKTL